jgi:hypothetical protein
MRVPPPGGASDAEIGDLDAVFAAFVAEYRQPSFEAVCAYLQRYLRYARELIEFSVEWAALARVGAARSREEERRRERRAEEALTQPARVVHACRPAGWRSSGSFRPIRLSICCSRSAIRNGLPRKLMPRAR